MTQLQATISKVLTGKNLTVRTKAAEHLFEITRGTGRKIDDKTITELASLMDSSDDSVRYWVARCLGNFGPRARMAAPKLEQVLAEVDCLQGSKTSASGIRFALGEMGITPPPAKCGTE
jgi:HEAT repeat protein